MTNILIAGNGLDLQHGYKTRYIDFLRHAKKQKWDDNCFIRFFISEVEANGGNLEEKIDGLSKESQWIDCEDEIQQVIDCFKHIIDIIDESVDFNYHCDIRELLDSRKYTIACAFKKAFDGDIQNILNHAINANQKIEKQIIVRRLKNELDTCIERLKQYLIEETKAGPKNENKFIDDSIDFIISLNYTDVVEKIYSGNQLKKTYWIHGSLRNDNMVLGTRDYDEDNLDFVYFKKYFQRIQKRTDLADPYGLLDIGPVNNFFYGCSFGDSDRDVLRKLLWADYEANGKYRVINHVFYYGQDDYENKVINLIRILGKEKLMNWNSNGTIRFYNVLDKE